jgi:hypothetical protein
VLDHAYRHVNIALVNDLAMVCDRLDPAAAAARSTVTVLLQDHARYNLEHLAWCGRVLLDTRGRMHGERLERL